MDKKKVEQKNKTTYEKPINLSGASFKEVLGALLNTKPMPKEEEKEKNGREKKA